MKKFLILFSISGLTSLHAIAQDNGSDWYTDLQGLDPAQTTLLALLGIILFSIILLLLLMGYLLSFLIAVIKKENPEMAQEASWWASFKERFVTGKLDEVGGQAEKEKMMADHSYDGITELDNFMPPWLQWVFISSVLFGVAYFVYYSVLGIGLTGVEEYQEELRIEAIAAEARMADQAASIDETTVTFDDSPASLAAGKSIYETSCVACHAADGGGGVGPNLTDDYWIHGGSIQDIFGVIKYGVVSKGMIPWQDQLSPEEMQQVSSYIMTLGGTSPANPKEPQGELFSPSLETESVTDSTQVVATL